MDITTSFDPEALALPFYDDEHRRFAEEIGVWCDGHGPLWEAVRRMDPDEAGRRLVGMLGEDGWLATLDPHAAPHRLPGDLRALCLGREALAYAEDLADFAYSIQSCRISGKRVSPVYVRCGSATAQAGGDSQKP
ncbi:hypothetical protein ACWDAZ_34510, partial [Streptomyces sp. NPDC001215]